LVESEEVAREKEVEEQLLRAIVKMGAKGKM
jgi:hypothetical protein